MNTCSVLRELIRQKKTVIAPGVFDGLSALLAKQAGFSLLYASGGAIARAAGYPDIGLLTMTEVATLMERIVVSSELPVIADADTGFGNAVNTKRTVQVFERIGVAGLHIEDQSFPKRCGHLNDKSLISSDEMCQKIRIAKSSCTNPDFVIIARTDAIGVEGFDAAIKRAKAYAEAGADMLFIEAPETIEQMTEISKQLPYPTLLNMFLGGKTPVIPIDLINQLHFNIVIIPSDLQRAAIKAMQKALSLISQHGNSAIMENELTSFQEREKIIGTEKYLAMK